MNSIAPIHLFPGEPDPNVVIYMFSSTGGAYQTLILLIDLIVLFRYRSLIPLIFVLMWVETGFRMVVAAIHPLTEEFYVHTPPGKFSNLPFGLLSVAMLYVSHRNDKAAGKREGAATGSSEAASA